MFKSVCVDLNGSAAFKEFLCLMCRSDGMEVNTCIQYFHTACTNIHTVSQVNNLYRSLSTLINRWQSVAFVADLATYIKDPLQRLTVTLSSSSLSALTVEHCTTKPQRNYTSSPYKHFFFFTLCILQWLKQLTFSPWFQVEIFGSPSNSFCLGPTQQCEREAGSPTEKFV